MSDHTTPFSHNEDVSRRFVIFDMFNTLVKLKGDIGRYDIVHVLHESYLSDFDFDDVARHYDDIARILVAEKRAYNLEIVFTEMVDHILTELGVRGGHDLAEIEEYVFHGGKFISEMEGAEETLRFFKDNGYTVAILSNSYFLESTLWSALRSLGIDGYVDMIGWDICVSDEGLLLIEGNSGPCISQVLDPNEDLWGEVKGYLDRVCKR